jgi:FkbM family methyltransferase
MAFYAQYEQDKILDNLVFKGFKNGIFVDVGAHDGKSLNNTLYFEETHNWNGINIEPMKDTFDELSKNRPKSINLNLAISEKNGKSEFLLNSGYTNMLSGLKEHYDNRHLNRIKYENITFSGNSEIIHIETKRLDLIFLENGIKHVHFLSIDVEGAEFSVIKSIDFDNVFIDVIMFENNYNDTSIPIIEYLKTKNYKVLLHDKDITMISNKSEFNNL